MPTRSYKSELVDRIRAAHEELAQAIAALPADELVQAGVTEQWSVKDVMAHLTYWEQEVLTYIAQVERGEEPPDDSLPGETNQQRVDRLNEANYQRNRSRPLDDVQVDFARSYQEMLTTVEGWDDADVAPGGRLEQLLGVGVEQALAGDTWEHYQEHADQIQEWRAREDRTR
jgi:hypothetical protein